MFTIQYETINGEHKTQNIDGGNRQSLIGYLARFDHPIVAIYEQATVVTKTIRRELRNCPGPVSRYARDFMNQA